MRGGDDAAGKAADRRDGASAHHGHGKSTYLRTPGAAGPGAVRRHGNAAVHRKDHQFRGELAARAAAGAAAGLCHG